MSQDIKNSIEALNAELNGLYQRASEIKKIINDLSALIGLPPPYSDIATSIISGNISNIQPDQFYGKGLSTAVKEYLKLKGRAATVEEIFDGLNRGGFEYPNDWKDKYKLKNLAISLSKNRFDFVYVKTDTISAFGLWEFYPEKKREREKAKSSKELAEEIINEPNITKDKIKKKIEDYIKDDELEELPEKTKSKTPQILTKDKVREIFGEKAVKDIPE